MSRASRTGSSARSSLLRLVIAISGLIVVAVGAHGAALSAQPAPTNSKSAPPSGDPRAAWLTDAKSAMASFAWLAGEWEGLATVRMGNGGSMKLVQRESVTAAGLFAYNAPSKAFSFSSASGSGMAQTVAVIAQGEGFTWYYSEGDGARVRYVITHTPDDKWKEIGERSTDGGATWSTTIDLLLARKH